jgi:hypothetical protein
MAKVIPEMGFSKTTLCGLGPSPSIKARTTTLKPTHTLTARSQHPSNNILNSAIGISFTTLHINDSSTIYNILQDVSYTRHKQQYADTYHLEAIY